MTTLNELKEERRKQTKRGTYSGLSVDTDTSKKLVEYISDNNIPNPTKPGKLHLTLLYSRKHLPNYKPAGELDTPYECKATGFDSWKTTPEDPDEKKTNCLIVRLTCPEITKRHEDLMKEHGATWDYDDYRPHIALSYNIGDLDVSKLPKIDFPIVFDKEYMEELNLNWAKTKGTK